MGSKTIPNMNPLRNSSNSFEEHSMSSKIYLNLEQLIKINELFESIIDMGRSYSFEAIFNKATQWWDETLKLQDCFITFYQVTFIIFLGEE